MRKPQEFQPDQSRVAHGRAILNLIKAQDNAWISRADLAQVIGSPDAKIGSNNAHQINRLVELKLIEAREVKNGEDNTTIEYRYIAQK